MNESLMYGSEDQAGKRFPVLSSTSKGNPQNSPIQSANFEGTLKACGQNDLYLGGETPLDKSTG